MNVTRRALLGGGLGLAGLAATGAWRAPMALAADGPTIIGCDEWGAKPARGALKMVGPPKTIVVHHTSSPNVTDYSRAAADKIARSIQSWHFDRKWSDSGQHFTISRGGFILEGRHRTLEGVATGKTFPQGAHTNGQNGHSLGIENQGTYNDELPPQAQWDSLVALCAHLCRSYGLDAASIEGHRHFNDTDCPGTQLFGQLDRLRNEVSAQIGSGSGGGSGERAWPKLRPGSTGFQVTAVQHLLTDAGHKVEANGTFDDATTAAAKAFQTAKGLEADAVIGRLTWEAPLAVKIRKGDRRDAVKALQVALIERGHAGEVDGSFGPGTVTAVKAFQTSAGLAADAVVGPDTWAKLLA